MLDMVTLSDELTEKVFAFVEREAGRDAPLSTEDEALVRDLLENNPAAQALADDMRATNSTLDMVFNTDDIEVPDELVTMIRAHGDLRKKRAGEAATDNVVPLRQEPATRTWSRGPLAAAASIVLILAAGGGVYTFQTQQALDQAVAKMQRQTEEFAANLAARELRLDETEAALAHARRQTTELVIERETLAGEVDQGEQSLASVQEQLGSVQQQSVAFQTAIEQLRVQSGLAAQVAGYHLGYAGNMREVEITAEQEQKSQMLTTWLSQQLGRAITIPDLSDAGMTFVGGRLFFVNGQPVGQIAYHDRHGRLTGFCLKRNSTGREEPLSRSQHGNVLQMVSWQDQAYQYLLVGFEDFETLEPLAQRLERGYGETT